MANDRKKKMNDADAARAADLQKDLIPRLFKLAELVGRTMGHPAAEPARVELRKPQDGSADRWIACFIDSNGNCGCYDPKEGICFPC